MKRHIFCSILLFFVPVISYACENLPCMIKCDDETVYKYWAWKELSNQYGDAQFRSFLNHKVAYALSTCFDPKPRTKTFVSLDSLLLRQALWNTKKLQEEKSSEELGVPLGYRYDRQRKGSFAYSYLNSFGPKKEKKLSQNITPYYSVDLSVKKEKRRNHDVVKIVDFIKENSRLETKTWPSWVDPDDID